VLHSDREEQKACQSSSCAGQTPWRPRDTLEQEAPHTARIASETAPAPTPSVVSRYWRWQARPAPMETLTMCAMAGRVRHGLHQQPGLHRPTGFVCLAWPPAAT
jgi:hypothetical protein